MALRLINKHWVGKVRGYLRSALWIIRIFFEAHSLPTISVTDENRRNKVAVRDGQLSMFFY